MQYFTPQLWIAFQGAHRNAAFKTWDRRFAHYRKALEKVLPGLRPAARRFFRDALILHDGTLTRLEIGDRIEDVEGKPMREIPDPAKLSVRMFVLAEIVRRRRVTGRCLYILEYKSVQRIHVDHPGKLELFPVGFDSNFGDWGYDELTSPEKNLFRHEILFASGATITIDFRDFSFRRKPRKTA